MSDSILYRELHIQFYHIAFAVLALLATFVLGFALLAVENADAYAPSDSELFVDNNHPV